MPEELVQEPYGLSRASFERYLLGKVGDKQLTFLLNRVKFHDEWRQRSPATELSCFM